MKKYSLIIFVLLCVKLSFSQNSVEADKIIGIWQTGSGKAKIQITKYGDKYGGKIVWLKTPNYDDGTPKTDKKNPNEAKRNTHLIGLNNLLGFNYTSGNKFENGTIYDPENGKTYKCIMTLESDVLKVRGYVGITLLGRTDNWTRVTN